MSIPEIFTNFSINTNSDRTLITQIKEQITWMIASGDLIPGDKLPAIRDLADHLGVHMHTVREAYHRLEAESFVSIRTRRGTIVSPLETHQFHSPEKDSKTNLIGVILPAPVEFYQPFIEAVQVFSREHQYLPVFSYISENYHLIPRIIHQLLSLGTEGFIQVSTPLPAALTEPDALDSLPPLISVDQPEMPGHSLLIDSKTAAFQLTAHLIDHGYDRVGLITPPTDWGNTGEVLEGYRQALQDRGLNFHPELVAEVQSFFAEDGSEGARTLLQSDQPPRAILASSDSLALGLYRTADQLGLSIPEDLAVAGYNDIPTASFLTPPLTTASIPIFEIGKQAVESLHSLIQNSDQPTIQKVFQPELIIRASCGCPPSSSKGEMK